MSKYIAILWNSGNATLDGADIPSQKPLVFQFDEDATILSVTTLKESNCTVNFVPTISQNTIKVDFKWLEPKEGVAIEVYHTGKRTYPSFIGAIKGFPDGFRYLGQLDITSVRFGKMIANKDNRLKTPYKILKWLNESKIITVVIIIAGIALLAMIGILTYYALFVRPTLGSSFIAPIAVLLTYFGVIAHTARGRLYKVWRTPPKELIGVINV